MTRLSVNLNKVCLIRNAREDGAPDPVEAALICIDAGAQGLTLHPRADARHATLDDVLAFGRLPAVLSGKIELNIEGDVRPELLRTVLAAGAQQFTVVPVVPGERTSSRGWRAYDDREALAQAVRMMEGGPRVSVFCDATVDSVRLAAESGAQAVEFYTGHYARCYGSPEMEDWLETFSTAAQFARGQGLRVHAGHDLTTGNLGALIRKIRPEEVSIGHALIGDALIYGLHATVKRFLNAIREAD